jgi:hypothetical protein
MFLFMCAYMANVECYLKFSHMVQIKYVTEYDHLPGNGSVNSA